MKCSTLVLFGLCSCAVDAAFDFSKSPGFDGFGAPDPFNRNDDDEVDAGEPNAPAQHDSDDDDPNLLSENQANAENDDDGSFMQFAKKASYAIHHGFKGDPYRKRMSEAAFLQKVKKHMAKKVDDYAEVDAATPNAPPRDLNIANARSVADALNNAGANSDEDNEADFHASDNEGTENVQDSKDAQIHSIVDAINHSPDIPEDEEGDGKDAFLQKAKKFLANKKVDADAEVDATTPNAPLPDHHATVLLQSGSKSPFDIDMPDTAASEDEDAESEKQVYEGKDAQIHNLVDAINNSPDRAEDDGDEQNGGDAFLQKAKKALAKKSVLTGDDRVDAGQPNSPQMH